MQRICFKAKMILIAAFVAAYGIAARGQPATSYLQYGYQCLKLHDYQKAEGYFKSEIAYRNTAEAHLGLAQAYFFDKRQGDSERELQLASSLDPNGSWGNKARISLARMRQLATSSAVTYSARATLNTTPAQTLSLSHNATEIGNLRLSNGKTFNPCSSSNLREFDRGQLLRLQNKRADQLDASRKHWEKAISDYTVARNGCSENSPEWNERQQRIDESRKSIEADALEIDDSFMRECKDINDEADRNYRRAMAAAQKSSKTRDKAAPASNAAADLIAQENNERYKTLHAELEQKIAAIKEDGQRQKDELESSKIKSSSSALTDVNSQSINADLNERWAKVDAQVRLKILDLRKQYQARLEAVQSVSSDLNTQQHRLRDDDAELVPIGSTNMYARSYGTFGEPSGNPIPVIAEPGAIGLPNSKLPAH